jgi:hypothetical protein
MSITGIAARAVAADLERQAAHWLAAAGTFSDAEEFASEQAWRSVEGQVGIPLRRHLAVIVDELLALGRSAATLARVAGRDPSQIAEATRAVQHFRRRYAQVETTLDFFGDAVNSRTSAPLRAALQSLDALASASMSPALVLANRPAIPVLTYVDKGMGASILRSGIRLWAPGSINPVAAIKIVRHNLYRPTSLFHETGHQVAHLTGWTSSMSSSLAATLSTSTALRQMWTSWTSEIAADVFAFLNTGYASVTALYDVVGDARTILRWPVGDPHPIGWLRALLGCALCRQVYGRGPWDNLQAAVLAGHPLTRVDPTVRRMLEDSRARIDAIAAACLDAPVPAFGGRPMTAAVDPARVSPAALAALERAGGAALWVSPHFRRADGIRLIALAGLREAERPEEAHVWIERARAWMTSPAQAA